MKILDRTLLYFTSKDYGLMLIACILLNGCIWILPQISQAQDQGLVVNEIRNGSNNSPDQEYIELLLVGCPGRGFYPGNELDNIGGDPNVIDLRGWIIDDNNGDFNTNPDNGGSISPGHIRFANHPTWEEVPVGALIVIYNPLAYEGNFPVAEDPADGLVPDRVYILSIDAKDDSGQALFEFCADFPSLTNSAYDEGTCNYSPTTNTSWQYISLKEEGDGIQTRAPGASFFHGISYGASGGAVDGGSLRSLASGQRGVHLGNTELMGQVIFFDNNHSNISFNNYRVEDAYTSAPLSNETPGEGNNADNTQLINLFRDAAEAGADQIVCDLNILLDARGHRATWTQEDMWTFDNEGSWAIESRPPQVSIRFSSNQDPNATLTVNRPGVYSLRWTQSSPASSCLDSDVVEISFVQDPSADAGPSQNIVDDNQANLQGDAGIYRGTWSYIPSLDNEGNTLPQPFIDDPQNENAQVLVSAPGSYQFLWQVGATGCEAKDTTSLSFAFNPADLIRISSDSLQGFLTNPFEPSSVQSYTLEGMQLAGNLTIQDNCNLFELSTEENGHFSDRLLIPVSDGQLVNQPLRIYARLKAGLRPAEAFNCNLAHAIGGRVLKSLRLSGSVRRSAALAPPTDLNASLALNNSLRLTWADNSNDETGYRVYGRAESENDFSILANLAPNTSELEVLVPSAEPFYYFKVEALNPSICDSLCQFNGFACSDTLQVNLGILTLLEDPVLSQSTSVFPNPSQTDFSVNMVNNYQGTLIFELYDLNGQRVYQKSLFKNDKRINLPIPTTNFKSGIFLLLIKSENGSTVKKLLKE